jgi:hypothetical protein
MAKKMDLVFLESPPFDLVHIGFEEIRLKKTRLFLEILKCSKRN